MFDMFNTIKKIAGLSNSLLKEIKKDIESGKVSPLFGMISMSASSSAMVGLGKKGVDIEEMRKSFNESFFFYAILMISNKRIADRVSKITDESYQVISKKLLEELYDFTNRHNFELTKAKQIFMEGSRNSIGGLPLLFIERCEENTNSKKNGISLVEDFDRKYKEGVSKIMLLLEESEKHLEGDKMKDLFTIQGHKEEISVFETMKEKVSIGLNINPTLNKYLKIATKERKDEKISHLFHMLIMQGFSNSIAYIMIPQNNKMEIEQIDDALFEIAYFHMRMLINSKKLRDLISENTTKEKEEIKNSLMKELDEWILRSDKNFKKVIKEYKRISSKGEKGDKMEFFISRILDKFGESEERREIYNSTYEKLKKENLEVLTKKIKSVKKAGKEII
jgi:hypothetical protein